MEGEKKDDLSFHVTMRSNVRRKYYGIIRLFPHCFAFCSLSLSLSLRKYFSHLVFLFLPLSPCPLLSQICFFFRILSTPFLHISLEADKRASAENLTLQRHSRHEDLDCARYSVHISTASHRCRFANKGNWMMYGN